MGTETLWPSLESKGKKYQPLQRTTCEENLYSAEMSLKSFPSTFLDYRSWKKNLCNYSNVIIVNFGCFASLVCVEYWEAALHYCIAVLQYLHLFFFSNVWFIKPFSYSMTAEEPTGNITGIRGELMKESWGWWEAVGYQSSLLNNFFPLQMGSWFILLPHLNNMLQDVCLPWQLPLTSLQSIPIFFSALQTTYLPSQVLMES